MILILRSPGYAYINYNSAQDATHTLELLNFALVEWAQKKSERGEVKAKFEQEHKERIEK